MRIYLDIDGVLIPEGHAPNHIPPQFGLRLRKILDATGASLVISSTRRRSPKGVMPLLAAAGIMPTDFADDWATSLNISDLDPELSIRGQEISDHNRRAVPSPYLIIDDFPVLTSQAANHIQPAPKIGLTDAHVQQAIAILTSATND